MGSHSSSQQYRKRDPESTELTNMRRGVYNAVAPLIGAQQLPTTGNSQGAINNIYQTWTNARNRINQANSLYDSLAGQIPTLQGNVTNTSERLGSLADTIASTAQGYTPNNQSMSNLAGKIEGVGDTQGNLAKTIQNFTETGNIPTQMLNNMNKSVNTELNDNTGTLLNNLASRGVLNSSVTNRGVNSLADSAADAYAKNYLNAYNAVLNGYGQTNSTLASQGDTYSKALSGYNTANQGITNQIAGYGNAVNALNSALGGYESAMQNNTSLMQDTASLPQTIIENAMAPYTPAYNFWKDLQNSYDSKEDYDTVVKQGK